MARAPADDDTVKSYFSTVALRGELVVLVLHRGGKEEEFVISQMEAKTTLNALRWLLDKVKIT